MTTNPDKGKGPHGSGNPVAMTSGPKPPIATKAPLPRGPAPPLLPHKKSKQAANKAKADFKVQPQIYGGPPKSGAWNALEAARRAKRAQVKNACVHCQKACKKCDNKRPCGRCVKMGLEGCVDSMRKSRKRPSSREASQALHIEGVSSGSGFSSQSASASASKNVSTAPSDGSITPQSESPNVSAKPTPRRPANGSAAARKSTSSNGTPFATPSLPGSAIPNPNAAWTVPTMIAKPAPSPAMSATSSAAVSPVKRSPVDSPILPMSQMDMLPPDPVPVSKARAPPKSRATISQSKRTPASKLAAVAKVEQTAPIGLDLEEMEIELPGSGAEMEVGLELPDGLEDFSQADVVQPGPHPKSLQKDTNLRHKPAMGAAVEHLRNRAAAPQPTMLSLLEEPAPPGTPSLPYAFAPVPTKPHKHLSEQPVDPLSSLALVCSTLLSPDPYAEFAQDLPTWFKSSGTIKIKEPLSELRIHGKRGFGWGPGLELDRIAILEMEKRLEEA